MRDTDYDRLVSVFVLTCGREIDDNSLICHLYFAQKLGFSLDFNFRVNQRGVSCSKAESYINDLVIDGKLCVDRTKSVLSYPVKSTLDRVSVAGDDFYLLEDLRSLFSDLDSWEMSFLVTLDILQEECLRHNSVGNASFAEVRDEVVGAMKRLCTVYSDELFDAASERLIRVYSLGKVRGIYAE